MLNEIKLGFNSNEVQYDTIGNMGTLAGGCSTSGSRLYSPCDNKATSDLDTCITTFYRNKYGATNVAIVIKDTDQTRGTTPGGYTYIGYCCMKGALGVLGTRTFKHWFIYINTEVYTNINAGKVKAIDGPGQGNWYLPDTRTTIAGKTGYYDSGGVWHETMFCENENTYIPASEYSDARCKPIANGGPTTKETCEDANGTWNDTTKKCTYPQPEGEKPKLANIFMIGGGLAALALMLFFALPKPKKNGKKASGKNGKSIKKE